MRSFLVKLIVFILPVFILVIAVNYFGDAANIFSKGYEKKIAAGLLKGKNVTNVYNYDERLLQKDLLAGLNTCPQVAVIGSSRTMLINSSYFPDIAFLNNSVSNATIEDMIAIMELYKQKKCLPEKVIFSIDPWMFDENSKESRWQSLSTEYNGYLKRNKMDTVVVTPEENTYAQLFSLSYFNSSISQLLKRKSKKIIITDSKVNKTFTRLSDGSIVYDAAYRNVSVAQVNKKATIFKEKINLKYSKMSEQRKQLFTKFITQLRSEGVEPTFFLAPFHPYVYDALAQKGNIKGETIQEREAYCFSLAKQCGANVIGSYNPATYNLDASFFYDGMHCNEKAINVIMRQNQIDTVTQKGLLLSLY